MKKLSYLLVLIVVTFLSVNCSSNIRNLQRGDYYNATMGAIKTLRSNPNVSFPFLGQLAIRLLI
jgi:hypothetical protein